MTQKMHVSSILYSMSLTKLHCIKCIFQIRKRALIKPDRAGINRAPNGKTKILMRTAGTIEKSINTRNNIDMCLSKPAKINRIKPLSAYKNADVSVFQEQNQVIRNRRRNPQDLFFSTLLCFNQFSCHLKRWIIKPWLVSRPEKRVF